LVEIDLDSVDRPAYHALSYTWANPLPLSPDLSAASSQQDDWDREHTILVTGPHDDGPAGALSVSRNLYDFLRELHRNGRSPLEADYIWIDRICINQDDLAERAAQVALMGRVFHDCVSVIAWLGVEGPETRGAFNVLATVGGKLHQSVAKVLQQLTEGEWDDFAKLLGRAWFYRGWTCQESILPPDGAFWCGSFRASMRNFERPVFILGERLGASRYQLPVSVDQSMENSEPLKHIRSMKLGRARWILRHKKLPELPDFLARHGRCSDPRDYVYSTLGLFEHAPVEPDYTKPVDEVYRDFVLAAELPLEDMLFMIEDQTRRVTPNLPSWVPDFQVPCWPSSWKGHAALAVYNAGAAAEGQNLQPLAFPDGRTLAVHGFQEDSVANAGADYTQTMDGDGILLSLSLFEELIRDKPRPGDAVEAFWRTLTLNLTGSGSVSLRPDPHGLGFCRMVLWQIARAMARPSLMRADVVAAKEIVESLRESSGTDYLPSWTEIWDLSRTLRTSNSGERASAVASASEGARAYLTALYNMFEGRRFYITGKGRLGVGPTSLQRGDRVFIFKGARFPVLLRDVGNGRHTFLGACYVEGIMHGEALAGAEFERVEIE
jgi:hypothetical protein